MSEYDLSTSGAEPDFSIGSSTLSAERACSFLFLSSLVAQLVRNLPVMQDTLV